MQATEPPSAALAANEIDVALGDDPAANEAELWRQIAAVTRGGRVPAAAAQGFVDFQLTRGLLGVTT